jgi:hypothetical protein
MDPKSIQFDLHMHYLQGCYSRKQQIVKILSGVEAELWLFSLLAVI